MRLRRDECRRGKDKRLMKACYYTLFKERGGQGPPFTFQRGGLFEKRGGQIFFVRPFAAKTDFTSY